MSDLDLIGSDRTIGLMASLIEIKVNISLLKLSNNYSRARKRVGLLFFTRLC